jgi:hypothetical protein
MRGAPYLTFSCDMRLISRMIFIEIGERPGFERDFLRQ